MLRRPEAQSYIFMALSSTAPPHNIILFGVFINFRKMTLKRREAMLIDVVPWSFLSMGPHLIRLHVVVSLFAGTDNASTTTPFSALVFPHACRNGLAPY